MHSSEAFLNRPDPNLELLNTLLASPQLVSERSADERQADEESRRETVSKPGGFKNDPDEPTNPNEVREQHLNKVKKLKDD